MELDNLKINVEVGKKGTEKLIDVLVDLFSPVSEGLGLFGDAVRLARIDVAASVARKAKALAEEHGLKLKQPPLKFLVPFFEKASIEDLNDDTLVSMWSRLLVAAGTKFEARQLRYSTLLSEMSGDQARILQGIAHNYGMALGVDVDPLTLDYDFTAARITRLLGRIKDDNPDDIIQEIKDEICRPGVSVISIFVMTKPSRRYFEWAEDQVYKDGLSVEFDILRSFGLLDRVDIEGATTSHADVDVSYYRMTELGYEFWSACCGVPRR